MAFGDYVGLAILLPSKPLTISINNGLSLRLGLVTHAAAVADIGDRAGKVGDVEHF